MSESPEDRSTTVLLLAAGASRRFGSDKRKALVYQGQSLLEASADLYRRPGLDLCVCLSAQSRDDDLAVAFADTDVRVLRCARASEGMGGTLAEAAQAHPDASALIVALADMPLISIPTLDAMLCARRDGRIVVPVHDGRRGHPVLFDRPFIAKLQRLGGDRGAAAILAAHADAILELPVTDPGIHRDADTPEALAALRAVARV